MRRALSRLFGRGTARSFWGLVLGFLALYALTAQRGLGWGDSGEFQYRILVCDGGVLAGAESFATAHPLYVALARLVCRTPFHVTLLSSLFGALSVGGLFLCTRRLTLAVLFGLSHMVWWLSCLAEVQTMSLAFIVFETFLLLRFLETERRAWLVAAAFLTGLHLNCHNAALLAGPAFLYLFVRTDVRTVLASLVAGALGASYWLVALATRGFGDVLVGRYGAQVSGLLPENGLVTAFNFALAGLSLAVPAFLAVRACVRRRGRNASTPAASRSPRTVTLMLLLAVHALFVVRYFVPDQATFLLPTLFFAFALLSEAAPEGKTAALLALAQLVLPLAAWGVFSLLPTPEGRTPHRYRDDAAYFALPWKCHDTSADRYAAECPAPWTGYPNSTLDPQPITRNL